MQIIIIPNSDRLTLKGKPVTYIKTFEELEDYRKRGQVHEIHGIIGLEKMHILIAENLRNFSAYQIIEILLIL